MKFFKLDVPMPCPFHSASLQAKSWNKTHEMIIAVDDFGKRFTRLPRHQTGVNTPIIKGGKWQEANPRSDFSGAVECNLPKGMRAPKF